MNLDNSHGTRCENQIGVKGPWIEIIETLLEEVRKLDMGMKIMNVEESKELQWIWGNSSNKLKNWIVRKERNKIELEEIKKELQEEYKEEMERQKIWAQEREAELMQNKIKNLEFQLKEVEQKKDQDRMDRLEREISMLRRTRSNEFKICNNCGNKGHIARFCREEKINTDDLKYNGKKCNDKEISLNRYNKRLFVVESDEGNNEISRSQGKVEIRRTTRKEGSGTKRRKTNLEEIEQEYSKVFAKEKEEIKYCNLEKCKIETTEGEIVIKKSQRIPNAILEQLKDYIKELESRKIIRESKSMWRNPVRAIQKPDGSIRLVSNLMALNDLVKKDEYSIPNIRDVIRATQGSKWFTVLDLKDAFYHIEIEEIDKHKTAFEIEGKIYEWNSLIMGFKNAPQLMQRVMNRILGDLKGKGVEVYIDDIVIHSTNTEEHDKLIEEVLTRLENNKMKVNKKKYSGERMRFTYWE